MTQNLSDLELSRRLRALGVDVGPITSTTRDVYVRKYRALQAQQKPPPAATTPPLNRPSKPAHVSPLLHRPPSTSPRQRVSTTPPPATPPPKHPAPPLGVPGREDTAAAAVVGGLLLSLDNWGHVASDTAFLFPSGDVIVASRAILATQCSEMVPILYNTEVPYSVSVTTLSGHSSQFMVRSEEVVRDLKEKICLVHSIPVPQQRLIFKQQELPDSSTFKSLQILSGATVHLVLVATEMGSPRPTPSYTCTEVTPTLSIHHFTIGLSPEQLACFAETPPIQQQQTTPVQSPVQLTRPVSLPSHITHLVHAQDTQYSGFRMFLSYLYGRKLLQHETGGSNNHQCSSYVMCYILGAYFQLPELVGACISAIGGCLTGGNAPAILEFSKSIQSEPLQQLCIQYMNTHNSTT